MRVSLFIFFLLFVAKYSAQTASIIFKCEYNDSIQITINQIKQHNNYSNNIQIKSLEGKRSYNVIISFRNDSVILTENIYLIGDNLAHIYSINKKEILLKKIVPFITYSADKNQLILSYIQNTNLLPDTIQKDTLLEKDTTYVPPFETYYKLEDYKGRIGCPWPIKSEKLTEFKGIILAETLEDNKLEKIKIAVKDMDSTCIMVNQLKELLVLFEYEETKLDFAKFISSSLFDIDNVGKLSEVFNFENSMDELKEFIKKD